MKEKLLFVLLLLFSTTLYGVEKPALFLLKNYTKKQNINSWYMSEKLDGVRAYWDGEKLISRSGKVFAAPKFFTKDFPKFALDGELWSKRGEFSKIASIVNTKSKPKRWSSLTYNIFEVPNAKGDLLQRLSLVKSSKYLKIIKQIKIKSHKDVKSFLKYVEKKGGEGIVLRDATKNYYTGRTKDALKLKSYLDTECKVVGYTQGKGKFKGSIGSLLCEMKNSKVIKIGTGLSTSERKNPPKVGTIVTFKYYGITSKGNPRFPVYLRVRDE